MTEDTYGNWDDHYDAIEKMREILKGLNGQVASFNVIFQDGTAGKVRVFISPDGHMGFLRGSARCNGYRISVYHKLMKKYLKNAEYILPITELDRYCGNLSSFKKAFKKRCHPHLWGNIQQGYANFSVGAFKTFEPSVVQNENPKSYNYYEALCRFIKIHPQLEGVITENQYKTTTIRANRPRSGWKYRSHERGNYQACIENIARHIENKEDFSYAWRSGYDVSVSGKICNDGTYRAWLSLEYYGCGNGHYYLLINENSAVFSEKD